MENNKQLTIDNGQLTVTVSQVNRKIANLIKGEKSLSDIRVSGEISSFTDHVSTGRLYFALKDETSSVRAVMWSTKNLKFKPCEGMGVVIRGEIRAYEPRGEYQLTVHEMEPEGMGALHIAFLELRERLEKEGLFAQKRPLPRQPETIAVITAETGAALQDILNTLGRRNPLVKVILIPALVQGAGAPGSLINAMNTAQGTNSDLIIFGRGGGSIEDLWAFNDEGLARAVFASRIPTISAVGHEVDFTICDFVADLRAATPTAAAELSVIDIGEVYDSLTALQADLRLRVNRIIAQNMDKIEGLSREIHAKSPKVKWAMYADRLDTLEKHIKASIHSRLDSKRQLLVGCMNSIHALSPMNTLQRGYSYVTYEGKAITDSNDLCVGDLINIKLHKGDVNAEVKL
jgi:exodeoxyribonuclease VII large subunit